METNFDYPPSILAKLSKWYSFLLIILLMVGITPCASSAAETYSEFGIIRANIAQYLTTNKWLVWRTIKKSPEKTEVVGCDRDGNIFVIRGVLKHGSSNLLALESYEIPSVIFSTKEGYLYIWNSGNGRNPFEYVMPLEEYKKTISKFKLFPLMESSTDGTSSFELVKNNPEFYDHVLGLPKAKSVFHLENPAARRLKVGMFLDKRPDSPVFVVTRVLDNSAADAAGIKSGDFIVKILINGIDVPLEKAFPLPEKSSIRILSVKVERNLANGKFEIFDADIFLPSSLEGFLSRPIQSGSK